MYSPVTGRFLSADSIVPEPGNPQDLNRFAYSLSNPTKYTDPSGHSVDCGITDPYCRAGKLDVSGRANDVVLSQQLKTEDKRKNWSQLSKQEQSILSEAGWGERGYNAEVGGTANDLFLTTEDPALYLSGGTAGLARGAVVAGLSKTAELGTSAFWWAARQCVTHSRICAGLLANPWSLKYTQTVTDHLDDLARSGRPSRPYMNTTLVVQEIMRAVSPTQDPGGLISGLRWDAPGMVGKTSGTWELVVDLANQMIVHYQFRGGK